MYLKSHILLLLLLWAPQVLSSDTEPSITSKLCDIFEHQGNSTVSSRWTARDGTPCEPPSTTLPPSGVWACEWKIDVSLADDGWVYSNNDVRRRRWLRKYTETITSEPEPVQEPEQEQTDSVAVQKPADLIVPAPSKSLASLILEDFVFRGFGFGFYKSLLNRAGGFTFRIPITQNFVSYFSRPYLPSVVTSLGIYYKDCPQTTLFISASLPVDIIRTFILRFLVVLSNALRMKKHTVQNSSRASASSNVIRRVGFSVSWRYKLGGDIQFRAAPLFIFLPQVTYLMRLFGALLLKISDITTSTSTILNTRGAGSGGENEIESDTETETEKDTSSSTSTRPRRVKKKKKKRSRKFHHQHQPQPKEAAMPIQTKKGASLQALKLHDMFLKRAAGLGLTSSVYEDGPTGSLVLSLSSFFYGRKTLSWLRKRLTTEINEKIESEDEEKT